MLSKFIFYNSIILSAAFIFALDIAWAEGGAKGGGGGPTLQGALSAVTSSACSNGDNGIREIVAGMDELNSGASSCNKGVAVSSQKDAQASAAATAACGAMFSSKKSSLADIIQEKAKGLCQTSSDPKGPCSSAEAAKCKKNKDQLIGLARQAAASSGMNAMQMMQMGQMGMQMLGQLASLAGSGGGSGGNGGGSAVTSAGPTAQSLGDSGVSAPASSSSPSTPSSTAASIGGTAAPTSTNLALGTSGGADSAGTPPNSSITAANGGASPSGTGGAGGALGANLGSTSSGTGTGTAMNSFAAMNAFNQDDGGVPAGGAMLGLKGSNDFQGLDPGKDPMGGAGALGGGAGALDPNGDASRGLASGDGQALAQNDVNDPGTSLFDLVSVKMREMKKRGSL